MLIAAFPGERPLIREPEQFPAIVLGTRARRGRKKTTGQKSCGEIDSFAVHSPFISGTVWQGKRRT